jgi:hypothetical protein
MYVAVVHLIASIVRGNGAVELRRRNRVSRWTRSMKRGMRSRGDWEGEVMVIGLY